jgi:hypothetical protein
MREQLEHLLVLAGLPQVELRVLPLFARGPAGVAPFTHLSFPGRKGISFPDVVQVRHLDTEVRLEREADTYPYTLAFDQLMAAALDEAESIELIESAAAWFTGQPSQT